MKKSVLYLIVIALLATAVLAALNSDQRSEIKECQKNCKGEKEIVSESCEAVYDSCEEDCFANEDSCIQEITGIADSCKQSCVEENLTDRELRTCDRACERTFRKQKRAECDTRSCKHTCNTQKRVCLKNARDTYTICRNSCRYDVLNISCGNYSVGERFVEGCNECECNRRGEITCKPERNCGYDNFSIPKESCTSLGSLFQPVCKGPYFRLRCTRDDFCICQNNEGCTEGATCLKDFSVRVSSPHQGWKGTQGEDLGDIGICAYVPEVPTCGDGICQKKCDGKDCSMSEHIFNCPIDC